MSTYVEESREQEIRSQDSTKPAQQPAEESLRSGWLIFWGGLLVACLPFLLLYSVTLWRQDHYQYFPFVFLGVGYLFYARWDKRARGPRGKVAWSLVGIGCVILLVGAAIHSTWLGNLAFVSLAAAFLYSQAGTAGGFLGYLGLPLIMLIRMPQLHVSSLVSRLQKVTSRLADLALDVLQVPHDSLGNTLNLPTKELFVAEACSGIQSAFTMCFIALLIVVWKRRPLILAPVYLIAALVFAVLANTIRVLTIALAEYSFQYDLTSGWQHDMVGYLALLLCGGALLSFDSLCEMLFHPTRVPMHKRKLNPLALGWNYLLGFSDQTRGEDGYGWIDYNAVGSDRVGDGHASQRTDQQVVPSRPKKPTAPAWGMLGAAGVAGVLMLGGIALGRTDSRPIVSKEALLFDPPEGFLDGQVGILTLGGREVVRNGTDERLGLHADVWECGYDAGKGQVALSQPYVGWHELCVCYEALEWELLRRYNLPVPQGKPVALGEFEQGGKYGYLFFTAIDSDGSIPTPPSYTLFGRLVAPFYPLVTDDFAEISGSAQTVMLQFWTVRDEPLETTEKSAIAKSVAEMRQLASQQIVESVPPTAPVLPSAE